MERYEGPIESGMIFWGPGSDGEPFRRDLILCRHPFKPHLIIYEALPCKMRLRSGNVGEIGRFPEVNLRAFMRPEENRDPLRNDRD